MSKQREKRVFMKLPVRVWGMDSTGKLFNIEAHTIDITAVSACIEGDLNFLQRGAIIGVQCGRGRARFRVVWSRDGRIGVHSIERGKYIWGVALEREIETAPEDMQIRLFG